MNYRITVPQATRTRLVRGRRYIVPATSQWADWRDIDAITCHGLFVPRGYLGAIRDRMSREHPTGFRNADSAHETLRYATLQAERDAEEQYWAE